ncbi:MAG: hypothetical protein JO222_04595, partial [Frankiales bacterium]|nr:hypothetical protein [Frankiales bacterium]
MPSAVLDLLAVLAVVAVLRARPSVALTVLVVEMVAFPPTLVVPHTHTQYATLTHVLGLAGAVRLVSMRVDRTAVRGMMRRTPVHVALILFILAVFTFGVAFSSQASGLGSANVRLAGLLEQLAFFIVCMALVRVIGNIDAALRALAAAAVIAAAIAIIEHITLGSWGHWLFEHATQNRFTNASHQLALRGDTRRVKAGSDFALEFGWVMVVLLPAVVVTSLRHKWSQV